MTRQLHRARTPQLIPSRVSDTQRRLQDLLELPLQERVQLVELIWDSIASTSAGLDISPELKVDLEQRLKEFERDPEAGYSWAEVKSHLKNGTWHSA